MRTLKSSAAASSRVRTLSRSAGVNFDGACTMSSRLRSRSSSTRGDRRVAGLRRGFAIEAIRVDELGGPLLLAADVDERAVRIGDVEQDPFGALEVIGNRHEPGALFGARVDGAINRLHRRGLLRGPVAPGGKGRDRKNRGSRQTQLHPPSRRRERPQHAARGKLRPQTLPDFQAVEIAALRRG